MTSTIPETAAPWHAAYPTPKDGEPEPITRDAVLELIKDRASVVGKDFVLVDLRRADHEGGTIRGSINLPAHSLYPTIPTLYTLFKAAGVSKVIWYCSSSRGRGTRAAAWFNDYITEQANDKMQSLVLVGGLKGWVAGGADFVNYMEEYDASFWAAK